MPRAKFKSVGLEYSAYEKLKELAAIDRRSISNALAVIVEELYEDRVVRPSRKVGIAAVND